MSWFKSIAALGLLAAAGGGLGACSDMPRPFQAERNPNNELLVLNDPAGIVIDDVADLPKEGQLVFKTALVDQLHRADVPATLGQGNPLSFHLKGQVIEFAKGDVTDVQLYWLLVDSTGKSLGNHELRRNVDSKAWKAGDGKVLTQLARESTAGIARLLPDRREQLAAAPRSRAEQPSWKVLNNIVPPPGTGLGQQAKGARPRPQLANPQLANPQLASAKPGETPAAKPAPAPGQTPAVAIRAIEGAPGDGGDALARAMRHYLGRASIPMTESHSEAAAVITGKVSIREAGNKQQEVQIEWAVASPDGASLGKINQANKIPAGRLNGKWGDVAFAVAENAVQGLADLFDQLDGFAAPAAASPAPSAAAGPKPPQ